MWLDILRLFPQATVMGPGRTTGNGGRAKRSATFPGMRNLKFISPAANYANNKAAAAAAANKNREEDFGDEEEEEEEDFSGSESGDDPENEEEPEEISRPVVVDKPPQTPVSSKIVRKSSER